jgi:acetyl esterase/lipase
VILVSVGLVAVLVSGLTPSATTGATAAVTVPLLNPTTTLPPACSAGASVCNVQYAGSGGTDPRKLDIFLPPNPGSSRPAVIFIHGGGWWTGDKSGFSKAAVNPPNPPRYLADNGYVTFSINYRLSDDPDKPGPGDTDQAWIDQPADVAAAVQWVQSRAGTYGLDPTRIALIGASAGGHLALLHAMKSTPRVKAVVSWAGPTNMVAMAVEYGCLIYYCTDVGVGASSAMFYEFEGCALIGCPDHYQQTSPVLFVDKTDPRTLLVHGFLDFTVPVEQAVEMDAMLTAKGVPATAKFCAAGTHFTMGQCAWDNTRAWLPANV